MKIPKSKKIPPMVTFGTFNRLGNTIPSLQSLLKSTDDFELYLLDNFSQDHTWEYIQSVSDPRIVGKFRSKENTMIGLLNKILLNRKRHQDWLGFEYDCLLQTPNFISIFQEIFNNDSSIGALSGYRECDKDKLNNSDNFLNIKNHKVYLSGIIGYCWIIRSDVMSRLGFLDEVSFGMDLDVNIRIRNILKKSTGIALDVKCSPIYVPKCEDCKKIQSICAGNNKCTKYYTRTHSKLNMELVKSRMQDNITKKRAYCDTIFNPNTTLTQKEQEIARNNYKIFSTTYADFLKSLPEE